MIDGEHTLGLPGGPESKTVLHLGDSREVLAAMAPDSIESVVCDPPYEINFMCRGWDSSGVAFDPEFWALCLRVLKPGGHLIAFGATRTHHRIWCAIEDAGFEVRDTLQFLFGSGFPKSLDVSKSIDKAAGAEREIVGKIEAPASGGYQRGQNNWETATGVRTAPATDAAKQWDGWGTALKPAFEPILLARKPLAGTVAANVQEFGTGGINVDACRVGTSKDVPASPPKDREWQRSKGAERGRTADTSGFDPNVGRWPPNVLLTDDAAAELAEQNAKAPRYFPTFKYQAKASRKEREAGCEGLPGKHVRNHHPTVKPLALMQWLCRLVTPKGGRVLDPFMGSGTTGAAARIEGFKFTGIELMPDHFEIARARIEHFASEVADARGSEAPKAKRPQGDLFRGFA